jgi:filamentous hemagglutinin
VPAGAFNPVLGGEASASTLVSGDAPTSNILENAANGRAFEQQGLNYLEGIQNNVADQVSIRPFTESGDLANFRVRLDALGTDNTGTINLYDFKSSAGAGFTPNQQIGYPLLEQYGGQVVGGNGGLAYPAGTIIPPTPVQILRPGSF